MTIYIPDMQEMPAFETSSCSDVQLDKTWDLCIKVTYPDDNKNDYMLLEIFDSGTKTYIGKMKEEEIPVVFSWPDEDDGEVNATVCILI